MGVTALNIKNAKRGGKGQVEADQAPGVSVGELLADIKDLEGKITAKRGELVSIETKIRNAEHNLRLHSNFNGPRSAIATSDQAIVRDLSLQRSTLVGEFSALSDRLPQLKYQLSELQKRDQKAIAKEGDQQIRAAAERMVAAVEKARIAVGDYRELRMSFRYPNPRWPGWFTPLNEKRAETWISDIRRWLNEKRS